MSVFYAGSHVNTSNGSTWSNNRTNEMIRPTNSTGSSSGTSPAPTSNHTGTRWSLATTTAKTTSHTRTPSTIVTSTTVASTGWSSSGDGDDEKTMGGTTSTTGTTGAMTTTTTSTTTVMTSSQPTHSGGSGVKGTDVKLGGGGYDYGGGKRYGGGYDERDGETMMTTPVFGGEPFPPAAKPTPPKPAEPPINTKAAESTAFVVLVTAATLIIIVLIILLVLKVKYRTDTNRYKIDIPKAYGAQTVHGGGASDRGGLCHQQQSAGMLSPGNYPPSRQSSSPTYVPNNFRPHIGGNGKPKKRQDVKEWYV